MGLRVGAGNTPQRGLYWGPSADVQATSLQCFQPARPRRGAPFSAPCPCHCLHRGSAFADFWTRREARTQLGVPENIPLPRSPGLQWITAMEGIAVGLFGVPLGRPRNGFKPVTATESSSAPFGPPRQDRPWPAATSSWSGPRTAASGGQAMGGSAPRAWSMGSLGSRERRGPSGDLRGQHPDSGGLGGACPGDQGRLQVSAGNAWPAMVAVGPALVAR